MISDRDIIEKLQDLVQVDIDAVHAYGQAIEKIDIVSVREQVIRFQEDHQRHISDLSAVIRRLGGEPPKFSKDFKGFLLEGFTAVRSITGTEGALKALKSGEDFTNKRYSDARSWSLPMDILSIIQSNYEDEQRHLHYVEQAINDRVWETAGVTR
ncbi:MAG: PA2169 family four-helix-bundle protein [Alphaproteobacteria bacterium]|uniref:PA2169 family four-helix-bundle protein n=1 Tax=Candidatus Nitrobium versatile TaxID=2884831 RepID=A0A953LWE9_9BACT|nr:PA2169 family four-helix-bundle protein [Candidatus Nitrobium versatile]